MAARFNKSPNPSCANDLTGWLGAGTRTRITGLTGTPRTTGASVPTTAASFTQSLGCAAAEGAAPGQAWTAVGWVRHSVARTVRVALVTRQNGAFVGTGVAGNTDVALVANTWTQIRVTGTLGTGTFNQVSFHVDLPTATAAGTLSVSSCRVEQISDAALTYADGASGSGWVWDGTAGNSTSTLPDVAPEVPGSAAATFGFTATASGTGTTPGTATRHNLCPNPAAANNVSGYFTPNTSQARVTGQTGLPRTTGATGDAGAWTTPRCAVVAGTTYRASGYLKMPGGAGGSGAAQIHWYGTAGFLDAGGSTWSAAAGDVVRVDTGAQVAPVDAIEGILFADGVPTGAVLTAVLFEEGATLGTYFDGEPPGTWDGTAGNSPSTLVTVGDPEVTGSALANLGGLTATATGTRETPGSAVANLGGLTATATGEVDTTLETGSALANLGGLTATATGIRETAGAATAAFTFAAAASGAAGSIKVGAASAAIGFTAAATGNVGFAPGAAFLEDVLGDGARLIVEVAWGANLGASSTSWTWTDITRDVRVNPGISVAMGRADEASTSQPAQVGMVLDNTSGDYSLGGQSANYPYVRRNVPVRVRVDPADGGGLRSVFFGFADGFTPGWDALTGAVPVANLSAAGTLRRLAQGNSPVMSAYRRAMIATGSVVAYWPFEERKNATYAPAIRGGAALTFVGEPTFESDDAFDCSLPLPDLGTARFDGSVNPYSDTGEDQVRFLITIPEDGLPDRTALAHVYTSGTLYRWDILYRSSGTGNLSVDVYNDDGSLNISSNAISFDMNGKPRRLSLEMKQVSGNVTWQIGVIQPSDAGAGISPPATILGETVGIVSRIVIAPNADLDGVVFGHLTVQDAKTSLYEATGPLRAFRDEFTSSGTVGASRLERLGVENALTVTRYTSAVGGGNLTDYDRMGPQRVAPLLELLHEAEVADQGQLWDGRSAGLSYTTRRYRETGELRLTIDAAAGELHAAFEPVDDDQRNRNRVTASRIDGISSTYEDVDGPLGTATVGIYDSSFDVNNAHDEMALQYAAWHVHLGTVEGYRYPSVTVDAHSTPHLMGAALDLVPGDRIDVVGLDDTLAEFPTGTVSLIVEGISHDLSAEGWSATFKCTPFSPWGIARVAAETGDTSPFVFRVDTDGSSLAASRPAGATAISVASDTFGGRWTTDPDDYPLTLSVGGIAVVATACTGATSPQTFTVSPLPYARSAGTPVALHDPRPLGL